MNLSKNMRTENHCQGIHSIEECLSCYNYGNGDKSMVEMLVKAAGECGETMLTADIIAFVMEGEVRFTVNDNDVRSVQLSGGQMVFMSLGSVLRYETLRQSIVLIMRLNGFAFQLCQDFELERLQGYTAKLNSEMRKTIHILEANDSVRHLAKGLARNYNNGLRCREYFRNEILNFFIMLRAYYSGEELGRFLSSLLSVDVLFSKYVRTNWMLHRSVGSLAAAMKMTPQQFTRKFHRVFGQAPYEWMQHERARMVYAEICDTNKPLKEIVAQYGFPARANFNRFCKRFFGMNPGSIRKKKHKG